MIYVIFMVQRPKSLNGTYIDLTTYRLYDIFTNLFIYMDEIYTVSQIPTNLLIKLKNNILLKKYFYNIDQDNFTHMMAKILNMALGSYNDVDLDKVIIKHRPILMLKNEQMEWFKCLECTLKELKIGKDVSSEIEIFMSEFFVHLVKPSSLLRNNHSF